MDQIQSPEKPYQKQLPPLNTPSILDCIGNTPLARLDIETIPTLLAKLEYLNPGGSIKDRSALFMIEDAEKKGLLKPGGTIVEASSGNQGIALAMIGAVKKYRVIITVPDRTSLEKITTLRAYGAKVYICPDTDSLEDQHSYHNKAKELAKQIPHSFMPNQYYNVLNPEAHYRTTGPEIWRQTQGKVTHVFCAMGSCGTISGIGRYLKEKNKEIKIIGIDAETSTLSSSNPKAYEAEGIGVDIISDTLNREVIDEIVTISDTDCFASMRFFAKHYGLLVGISSGAVLHVARKRAQKLEPSDVVVVILADSGRAYLSKVFMK